MDDQEENQIVENKSENNIEDMEYSPYMDLFFPFIVHEEHRLSEQAVVLAGLSIQHNRRKSVLKQFDLGEDSKAFKRELEVLAYIQLNQN